MTSLATARSGADQIIQTGNLGDLVSAALDEFINRHRDEFLPVEPLRWE